MASAPQSGLPPFYRELLPLSSQQHGDLKLRSTDKAPHLAIQNAIPLTIEEFAFAQRYYPIVFGTGEDSIPLGLMGLNDGINTFVDAGGSLIGEVYVPAYVRRYPFMLARLRPEADELSLCFDPTSPAIGPFEDGQPLFIDDEPSPGTREVLDFCEKFERAIEVTRALVKELVSLDLLIDGELTIRTDENAPPVSYSGFRMVSEDKLRALRRDHVRKLVQSGAMSIIYAHLLSLPLAREIFARQIAQGKMPPPQAQPQIADPAPFSF